MIDAVATKVDLRDVKDLLAECQDLLSEIDGTEIPDDSDGAIKRRPAVANLNRRLLFLADKLGLAQSLVRDEYWQGRDT